MLPLRLSHFSQSFGTSVFSMMVNKWYDNYWKTFLWYFSNIISENPSIFFLNWDPPLYLRVFLYIGHWCLRTTSLGRFYYSHLMELNFKVYDRDWHSKAAVYFFFFNFKKFRITISWYKYWAQLVMNPPAMQETWIWSMDWDDSPGEGKSYPLQYSGLENSMNCIVHGIAKSWVQLRDFHFHFI